MPLASPAESSSGETKTSVMSGHVGNLSPEQEEALEKLRAAVSGLPLPEGDDYFFLRWLRARSFNVDKAEEMLRKHLDMRREMGADTILQDYTPPEVLKLCCPGGLFGEDREGRPIWWDRTGNYDPRGLLRAVTREDVFKLKCFHLEQMVALLHKVSVEKGRHFETIISVYDFANLSIQKHYYWPGIEILRATIAFLEDNYPERRERIFVINSPSYFTLIYNLFKHFMSERTTEKIIVCGADYQEVLQRYIAPDQIPQAYGGLRCEPNPHCTDYISPGCDVPERFYLTNLTRTSREEMESVVVGRGSSHKVKYQVHHPNSILQWEFMTTDHDIGFGVFHKPSDQPKVAIVPVQRNKSHIVPECGTLECAAVGTYILKFDNSYSWARSKEVFYHAEVLPPNTPVTEHTMGPVNEVAMAAPEEASNTD